MPKFQINVVKYGGTVIDAPSLDAATAKAANMPDSAFDWELRDFSDCGPADDGETQK